MVTKKHQTLQMNFKIKSPPLRHSPPPFALSLRPPLSSLLPSYFRDQMADDQCLREGTREAHSNEQAADHQCLREGPNEPRSPPSWDPRGSCWSGSFAGNGFGIGLGFAFGAGVGGGVSFGLPPQSVTDLEGTLGAGLEPGLGPAAAMSAPPWSPLPPPLPAQPRANCHKTSKTLLSATVVVIFGCCAVVAFRHIFPQPFSSTVATSASVVADRVASTG